MGADSPPPRRPLTLPNLKEHNRSPPPLRSPGFLSPRSPRSPRSPVALSFNSRLPRRFTLRGVLILAALVTVAIVAWHRGHVPQVTHISSLLHGARFGHETAFPLEPYDPIEHDHIVLDLQEHLAWTTYDGGVPGYSVFSNLYLFEGALVAVSPDAEAGNSIPAPRAIMSGPKKPDGGRPPAGEDRWSQITDPKLAQQMGKRAIRIPGITYIFNDPPGREGYMAFYEHFISELVVPAARVVAGTVAAEGIEFEPEDLLPTRIIFPRCAADPSWRDDSGSNRWFLQHALPGTIIEDATQWNDREASDTPFIFDRVIIVDRASAHSAHGAVDKWGKMMMNVPPIASPTYFWDPFRRNVISTIGDRMPHVGEYHLPVVVYVQRSQRPTMAPESHDAIVAGLKKLTDRAEVHVAQLKSMTRQEKISLLSRTSIFVGIAAADLIEAMWMPPGEGGVVIELFEAGGFERDNEAFVSMLNLEYVAISGDRVLPEKEWDAHGRKRGKRENGVIEVDGARVVKTVEAQLDRIYRMKQ